MTAPPAFLSYATRDPRDPRLVEALGARLRSLGVDPWHYESLTGAIPVGDAILPHLLARVRGAAVFGVVLSADALASRWVAAEVEAARPGVERGDTLLVGLVRPELGYAGLAAGPEPFRWLAGQHLVTIGSDDATVEYVAATVAERLHLPYVPGREGSPDFPLAARLTREIAGASASLPDLSAGIRALLLQLARTVEDAQKARGADAVGPAFALKGTIAAVLPGFVPYYSEVALGVVLAEAGRGDESEALFAQLAARGPMAVDENVPAALAWHAVRRGQLDRARELYREARARFRVDHPDADDPHLVANLLLCTVLAGGRVDPVEYAPLLDAAPPPQLVRGAGDAAVLRVVRATGLVALGRTDRAFAELRGGGALATLDERAVCDFLDTVELAACQAGDRAAYARASRLAEELVAAACAPGARGDWRGAIDQGKAGIVHRLARLWFGLGRYRDAASVFEALVAGEPRRLQLRTEQALTLFAAGDAAEGTAASRAAAAQPASAWIDDTLGDPPAPGRVAWHRGLAYALAGDWSEAARWYAEHAASRAAATPPAAPDAWYRDELVRQLPHQPARWASAPRTP